MKYLIRVLIMLAIVAGTVQALHAHHSFSATFNDDVVITVEGVVTEFSFKNPHVLVYFDVLNDDGTSTQWVSEGAAATNFRGRGWGSKTLQPGTVIRVSGNATHNGSPMVSMMTVDILDPESKQITESLLENTAREGEHFADAEFFSGSNASGEIIKVTTPLKLTNGMPNISGAWATNGGGSLPGPIVPILSYNETGKATQDAFKFENDPQVFCDHPGVVRQAGTTPLPFTITQLDDKIVIEYEEYGGRREIPYATELPAPGVKTHLGDAIAWVDGDAIVIQTVNLLENLVSPEGTYVSDQAWSIETFRRNDNQAHGSVLDYTMITHDPVYLKEPLVQARSRAIIEGYEMIENDCQPPLRQRSVVSPYTSFFLTSVGPGDGGNLGGLAGADAHCEALAESVGQGGKGWQAYLSTTGDGAVNAKDRIGTGPWYNAKGDLIAANILELHDKNNVTGLSVMTERAEAIRGRGVGDEWRPWHDILTGTQNDGVAMLSEQDTTCSNWTSNGEGGALVGHFDRAGGGDDPTSWLNAHKSRGCSQQDLQGTGGDGLFYCFARGDLGISSKTATERGQAAPARPTQEPDLEALAAYSATPPEPVGYAAETEPSTNKTSANKSNLFKYIVGALLILGLCFFAFRQKAKTDDAA